MHSRFCPFNTKQLPHPFNNAYFNKHFHSQVRNSRSLQQLRFANKLPILVINPQHHKNKRHQANHHSLLHLLKPILVELPPHRFIDQIIHKPREAHASPRLLHPFLVVLLLLLDRFLHLSGPLGNGDAFSPLGLGMFLQLDSPLLQERRVRERLRARLVVRNQDVVERDSLLQRPDLDGHAADRRQIVRRLLFVKRGIRDESRHPGTAIRRVRDGSVLIHALVLRVLHHRLLPHATAAHFLAARVRDQRRLERAVFLLVPVRRRLHRGVRDLQRLVVQPVVRLDGRLVENELRLGLVPVGGLDVGGVVDPVVLDPVGGLGIGGVGNGLDDEEAGKEERYGGGREGRIEVGVEIAGELVDLVDEDLDGVVAADDQRVEVR